MSSAEFQATVTSDLLTEIEAIYRTAKVGLCVLDSSLRFVRINERLAEMNGLPVEAHIGKTPREILPDIADWCESLLTRILETGEPALNLELSGMTPAQPGVVRHWIEQWMPIKDAAGRVAGVNVAVEEVTELKRLAENLARSNRELERFAYVASHDLREPLRTISVFLRILETRHAGPLPADALECIHEARRAATHLDELISGLLDYARVTGKPGAFQRVDLTVCLQAAISMCAQTVAETGATLAHDALPHVHGDPQQLIRVFQNLLANSLKYRREGVVPHVHVSAGHEEGRCVVTVRDNGIGIPARYREKVFELFNRVGTPEATGTGIGLAVCKAVVERHGGRIWVEGGPEQGARVRFTLLPA